MKVYVLLSFLFLGLILSCTNSQIENEKYAIQNVSSGKNLRPYKALSTNGNKIVLYNHVEWKCMTWEFINTGDNTFQLKNLFTLKTFQPSAENIQSGIVLEQNNLKKDDKMQLWEFIEITKGIYNIRLKGSQFYITQSDLKSENNTPIVLNKIMINSANQKWKLIKQNPKF